MSFAIRNSADGLPESTDPIPHRDEGEGQPLVFIHGWPLNLEMWNPQANALRARWRIIRLDRRGFGTRRAVSSLSGDVRDLIALFDQLDLRNAALIGMSQGARVAMRSMPYIADRVACLVLDGAPIDDAAGEPAESEVPLDRLRQLMSTRGIEAFRAEWIEHPLMRLHSPTAETRLLNSILESYTGADLTTWEARASSDFAPVAASDIDVPTLVLNGELDANRRRMGDTLHAALPVSQRAIIPGAGHLPNLDRPRAYTETLIRFIEQHGRTAI